MINESEEILAQKRGEMAYLNRECKKLRQRIIDYNTVNLQPIIHLEPDTNSFSTQLVLTSLKGVVFRIHSMQKTEYFPDAYH